MRKILSTLTILLASIYLISVASAALTISSVDADNIAPGQEGNVDITIKNNMDFDVEDVSFALVFDSPTLPLSPKGTSEETIDSLNEDEKDSVSFTLRADSNAKVGDYKIPFVLTYSNGTKTFSPQQGTIGIRISGSPSLDFSASTTTPVIGQKGKITLKLLNKGLGEAKFISVKVNPSGYTLLSEDNVFISSIDSNDFDSVSFDIVLKSKSASLSGTVEYRDSDNKVITKNFDLPLKVYTQDEAIKNGIISKSNTFTYILVIVVLVIIWFVWRSIRKKNRLRKSREAMQNGGK